MKQIYPSDTITVTLSAGATGLSDEIDLRGLIVTEIIMPGTWVSAALSFTGAEAAGGTFTDVFLNDGTEYNVPAAAALANRRIKFPPSDLLGDCVLKIRSGLTGAAVNQTTARTLIVKARGMA